MLFFEKENGNQSKVIMTKPYKETYLGKNEFLREFEPNTPSNEYEGKLSIFTDNSFICSCIFVASTDISSVFVPFSIIH